MKATGKDSCLFFFFFLVELPTLVTYNLKSYNSNKRLFFSDFYTVMIFLLSHVIYHIKFMIKISV